VIGQIFVAMPRRLLSVLLIVAWVVLSGLDMLEDIDSPSNCAVFEAETGAGSSSGAGVRPDLVNNIVESAVRIKQLQVSLFSIAVCSFAQEADLDFRRFFPLHKLYRVYLI
jgi:hypothetical protein